jgi:phosphatidylinositol-3-phosphatase
VRDEAHRAAAPEEDPVRKTLLSLAVSALVAASCLLAAAGGPAAAATSGPCGTLTTAPTYQHVIWIWMENHSYGDVIGSSSAPYLNSLATSCGLATNYHNVTHPSLPNYLAATSGMTTGQLPALSWFDCAPSLFCRSSAGSIFGQGESWKAYQESMPSNCATANSGDYAVRHNPPTYYTTLTGCSTDDVPFTQLATDLANDTLPAFSFVTPNLVHDMHNGTVGDGDTWLADNLPTILASTAYRSGTTAVFVTWDEGTGGTTWTDCTSNMTDASCRIATIVVSPSTPAGTISDTLFNHYSLLATTEELLGLPRLGQAASAPTMTTAFHLVGTA